MQQAAVDLETSLGYLLKQAASALHTAMDDVLRPLGLNVTQYSTLELLAQRPGLSGSELARGTFITRQSMHTVLQGLEAEGLLARPETARTGRVQPAELTPEGRARLALASTAVRAVEDRMRGGMPDDGAAHLFTLLQQCIEALGRAAASSG